MKKQLQRVIAGLLFASVVLAACSPATQAVPTATTAPTAAPTAVVEKKKVCEVTDTGGVDDKGFNQTAHDGILQAQKTLGWDGAVLESQQQTDYEKNINEFLQSKCDLIVTVGFLLGDATSAAAKAHPDQKFEILDYAYDPVIDNVWAQVYSTDQGGFLAGYVAASVTKTGRVATFGGINIPPVTDFMDGFVLGVTYYNEKNGTKVVVDGWDVAAHDGTFVGNFQSTDDGRRTAEAQMDQGADVIFPVAGPVGLGAAAAIKERGNVWMIGVDTDQSVSAPDFAGIILTSVLKRLDVTVLDAVKAIDAGTFKGGTHVSDLKNDGVGLADFHDHASVVSDKVKADLATIKAGIIAGTIKTKP